MYSSRRYLDLNGKPVERTPVSHPYTYNAFVVYKSADFSNNDNRIYSDRLYGFINDNEDYEKAKKYATSVHIYVDWMRMGTDDPDAAEAYLNYLYRIVEYRHKNKLSIEEAEADFERFVKGNVWPEDSKDREAIAREHFSKRIHLTCIMRGANVSDGYPYYLFFFRKVDFDPNNDCIVSRGKIDKRGACGAYYFDLCRLR